MTYHIKAEYECPKCSMSYVPFKEGMACPKCNFIESDTKSYDGFIKEVLASMNINKIASGRYRPSAWLIASKADAIQSTCFHFFDYLEQQKPTDPHAFLLEYIKLMKVDNEYNRKFIREVLLAVYTDYREARVPRLVRGRTRMGRIISYRMKK